MGHAVQEVYDSYGYPFFYASLITDVNPKAAARVASAFDLEGYPSAFFDGGYECHVGGNSNPSTYVPYILSSGARELLNLDLSLEMTWSERGEVRLEMSLTNYEFFNDEPFNPLIPEVGTDGCINIEYEFTTSAIDPEEDDVFYRFDFDDGTITDWFGPFNSGYELTTSHIWTETGIYNVRIQAKDTYDQESDWVESSSINMHSFLAGDCNADLLVNLMDVVYLIKFKYMGGPMPVPYEAGDVDGNIIVNILDITYLISFLYMGGPAPVYVN